LRQPDTARILHGPAQPGHDEKPGDARRKATIGYTVVLCLVAPVGLATGVGLGMLFTPGSARPSRPPVTAAGPAAFDAFRFVLNALLVPALDGDDMPLRWKDPLPAMRCGPDTTVRVNGKPLAAGAAVPYTPFELEWQTNECRPFGMSGPRFDGRVKLTVFREDWGFSAMIEPSSLRVTGAEGGTTFVQPGAALLQHSIDFDDPAAPPEH